MTISGSYSKTREISNEDKSDNENSDMVEKN